MPRTYTPVLALDADADAIDENLLLAETEDLLAALDATAFIASPLSTEDDYDNDNDCDGDDDSSSHAGSESVTAESSSAAATPLAASTAPPSITPPSTATMTGKKRVRSRDRTKDELVALRQSVVELEQHLVALRRSTAFVGRGHRNVTQTWGHIAKRQQRDRARAEAENAHLKALLLGQLRVAGRFDHSSNKRQLVALPAASSHRLLVDADNDNASTGSLDTAASSATSATSTNVMDDLIASIDGHYAEMHDVFDAAGIGAFPHTPQSFAQTRTTAAAAADDDEDAMTTMPFLELVEVRLIPFDVRSVGEYLWTSMKSWHLKNSTSAFTCRSDQQPDDTFAVHYRAQSKAATQTPLSQSYAASFQLVKRRFKRADGEVAVVWKSQSDGDGLLQGVRSIEIGWLVVTHVPAIDEFTPVTTALRACVHVYTTDSTQQVSEMPQMPQMTTLLDTSSNAATTQQQRLTSLVVDSFEEDVNSINQQMENLLLEEALAAHDDAIAACDDRSSESNDVTAEVGRIHFGAKKR